MKLPTVMRDSVSPDVIGYRASVFLIYRAVPGPRKFCHIAVELRTRANHEMIQLRGRAVLDTASSSAQEGDQIGRRRRSSDQ